eukprot:Clim_evm10s26 gene=Clim_evmTU10s26
MAQKALQQALDQLVLNQDLLEEVKNDAIEYALCNGIVVKGSDGNLTHAPFALLPSPIPRMEYKKALTLQPILNELVQQVAEDADFLRAVLKPAAATDDFTRKLLEINDRVLAEGRTQVLNLGMHRSDYMLDSSKATCETDCAQIKQIEINTIAASFGGLGTQFYKLHQFLLEDRLPLLLEESSDLAESMRGALPENTAVEGLASGLAAAHRAYGKANAVVMMIIQPGERNSFDQRWIEYTLWRKYQIRIVRHSLAEVARKGKILAGKDRRLEVEGREIAVAYYRAGYTPTDYPTAAEWDARLTIERSYAIKCPSMNYQLTGAKKVQQVLADSDVLARFLRKSTCSVAYQTLLEEAFAGLYDLDPGQAGDDAAKRAIENPSVYVLKPQREGGGNNLYDDDIAETLKTCTLEERSQYILMDRIVPRATKNIIVRNFKAVEVDVIGELGVYGMYLGGGGEVLLNEGGGSLLRSKSASDKDGGVAAGVAVLDSPYLVD